MTPAKVKILHVDDDEANRYAVTRALRRAGFEVTEAATGTDALRKVEQKPDLIILDVRLPDIDGFEVCRRIKSDSNTAQIPVLHLSASRVTSEDKAFGLNGGAEGYLVRPVEPVELVATIHALLRARRSEAKLQEREQQFNALIEGVREYAIFAVDPNGFIVSWHAGAERMLGYTAEEAIGMSCDRFFTPEQNANEFGRYERGVAADTGEYQGDGQRIRKDGSRFDAWVVLTATRSATGELLGFLKIVQDISQRKQAEAAREAQLASEQAARIEAERVGRMKDEFLATLSHEIRTPLNAILGWSQVMKASVHDAAEIERGLDVIERNARTQAQIIDDLLDMSRIISGKIRLEMQPIDLLAVVRAAVDTVTPAADAKGITLQCEAATNAAGVFGDANRLQQVFWNLLSNAIKFTPTGGRVSVHTRVVRHGFEVAITDTGEGIAPHFLPHVFDRFRQADASTTRRHGGLGLGLSIVKQLIEVHGGTVDVSSPGLGHGTTFTVRLPTAGLQSSAPRPGRGGRPVEAAPLPSTEVDFVGLRVLVVDDENDARDLIKRLLEDRHASVATAASVTTALDLFERGTFDVLISDIGMPGEDGYALIRQLRTPGPDGSVRSLPAIALTAYARPKDRDEALAAGFTDHLTKPIDIGALFTALSKAIGQS